MDARRFDALYRAFVRRKTVQELNERRMAMVTALYANSNWDDDKGSRDKVLENLEENIETAIGKVYGKVPMVDEPEEEQINKNDPFWAAMYRGLEKQHGTPAPTQEEMEADYKKHMGGAANAGDSDIGLEPEIDQ